MKSNETIDTLRDIDEAGRALLLFVIPLGLSIGYFIGYMVAR